MRGEKEKEERKMNIRKAINEMPKSLDRFQKQLDTVAIV